MKAKINIRLYGDGFSLRDFKGDESEAAKLFNNICRYFMRRGFRVTKDPDYQEDFKILSKYHKYGKKNDLEFKAERFGRGFRFEFYQNVNVKNSNGGYYDFNKYDMMPYMIKLSYRNEMLRLAKYLKKVGVDYAILNPRTDIEEIIHDEKVNTHIHGKGIETLEDICKVVNQEGYMHYGHKDANGKRIVCGETKYFYDWRNKRLSRGRAIHHINNMWWIIVNGKRHNIASFDLFDYSPDLPKREKLDKEEQLNRLRSVLRYHEEKMNYERCIVLRNKIQKLEGTQKRYRVWSIKWGSWWGPNNSGYTSDKRKAGVYLEDNISKHQDYYNDGVINKVVEITE